MTTNQRQTTMSAELDNAPEQVVTKTVTILGYIDNRRFDGLRDWASEVDPDTDYFDTYATSRTKHYLVGPEMKEWLTQEQYERLSEMDLGDLSIVEEVTTDKKYSNSPTAPVTLMVKTYFTDELGKEFNDWEYFSWMPGYRNADDENRINVWTKDVTKPLLKHPSEITDDDPYVDEDEEFDAVRLKVKYDVSSREELEMLDEEVTKPIIERLSAMDGIGRVRWMDCEVQTTEKGACFNI